MRVTLSSATPPPLGGDYKQPKSTSYPRCAMRASLTRLLLLFALAAVGAASPAAAQPPNIQVSSPSSSNPEQITISVDPTNPLRSVPGANENYPYVSPDGCLHLSESA